MKIFIAGATGVLGRRLVTRLKAKGHSVVGLARKPENIPEIQKLGADPQAADIFKADSLARAAEGCQAVIHAATAIPLKQRPSAADFAVNDHLRREGARALAACARMIGAQTYIFQSIIQVARPDEGTLFHESSPVHPERDLYGSAADGETAAMEGPSPASARMVFRGGWFYAPDAAHTRGMADALRSSKLPVIGPGDNRLRLIHVDDMASAMVLALEKPRTGIWHVVDDQPVTVKELFGEWARRMGAAQPSHIPIWLARVLAGGVMVNLLTANTETTNNRLKQDFGWKPQYPSYKEGLDQVLQEWNKA